MSRLASPFHSEPRAVSSAVAHLVLVRSMRLLLVSLVPLLLNGCVAQLQNYNSAHSPIAKNARLLPQPEMQQIIRTVTKASARMIVWIDRSKPHGRDTVYVYTLLSTEPDRFLVYWLQKERDGLWHINFSGDGSFIIREDPI